MGDIGEQKEYREYENPLGAPAVADPLTAPAPAEPELVPAGDELAPA